MRTVQITQYIALDETVFYDKEQCEKHDDIVRRVRYIMKDMNPSPEDDTDFANGGGYIQQSKSIVDKARKEITDLGNKLFKANASFGWIGRYFDDSGNKTLYSAWGRLSHIDHKYREWGQGYFAANPNQGTQMPFTMKTK